MMANNRDLHSLITAMSKNFCNGILADSASKKADRGKTLTHSVSKEQSSKKK